MYREDLNDLAIFAAVVEAGAFTSAGRVLGMPKSTVSTRISNLEDRLKVRLLERTTRRLALTEAGRLYFSACKRVLEEAERGRLLMENLKESPCGILRVSLPFAFARSILAPLTADFIRQFPDITLQFHVSNDYIDLIKEDIHLALRVKVGDSNQEKAILLGEYRQHLVASSDYLQEFGTPTDPDDLRNHRVIASSSQDGKAVFCGGLAANSMLLDVKPAIIANEPETRAQLIKGGCGIGWLPDFLCRKEMETGSLVSIFSDKSIANARIYAVTPTTKSHDYRVLLFVRYLQGSLFKPAQRT